MKATEMEYQKKSWFVARHTEFKWLKMDTFSNEIGNKHDSIKLFWYYIKEFAIRKWTIWILVLNALNRLKSWWIKFFAIDGSKNIHPLKGAEPKVI